MEANATYAVCIPVRAHCLRTLETPKRIPKRNQKRGFFVCVSAMTSPRPDGFRSRTGTHDLDSGMKVRLFLALSTIFALIGAICDRRTHFVTLIKSSPGGNRKKEYEKREREEETPCLLHANSEPTQIPVQAPMKTEKCLLLLLLFAVSLPRFQDVVCMVASMGNLRGGLQAI